MLEGMVQLVRVSGRGPSGNRFYRSIADLRRAVPFAVAALPAAVVLLLILTKGVDLPFRDEFHLVAFVLKSQAGNLTFGDFWAPLNEHRVAIPRLVVWLLMPLAGFDFVVLMLVAFAMALAALVFVWRTLRLTVGQKYPSRVPGAVIAAALLMFSVVQYETWLFALPALQWHTGTLSAALSVWALARWPGGRRALTMGFTGAAVSMLAVLSGMLLWPAVVVTAMCQRVARMRPLGWAPWLGAGGLVLLAAAYFEGFAFPRHHPGPVAALSDPVAWLRFVCAYLGTPFAAGVTGATAIGAAGLLGSFVLALVLARRRDLVELALPWACLWLFTLAVACVTAAGRVGLGPELALASRYAASAALFWVSIVAAGLLALPASDERGKVHPLVRGSAGLAAAAVLLLYAQASRRALDELMKRQWGLDVARQEMLLFESAPVEVVAYLYPLQPSLARIYLGFLKDARLSLFSGPAARIETSTRAPAGFHDSADCDATSGWALDAAAVSRPVTVEVYADEEFLGTTSAQSLRTDLRDAGIGTGLYGFSFPLPARLRDGRAHDIAARIAGTRFDLESTPRTITCPPRRN